MKKVYILIANSSNGYKKIQMVFTNREKAQRACERAMKDRLNKITIFYKVEEFEIQK